MGKNRWDTLCRDPLPAENIFLPKPPMNSKGVDNHGSPVDCASPGRYPHPLSITLLPLITSRKLDSPCYCGQFADQRRFLSGKYLPLETFLLFICIPQGIDFSAIFNRIVGSFPQVIHNAFLNKKPSNEHGTSREFPPNHPSFANEQNVNNLGASLGNFQTTYTIH